MDHSLSRRRFVQGSAAAAAPLAFSAVPATAAAYDGAARTGPLAQAARRQRLTALSARLTGGPMAERSEQTAKTYASIPDDDLLYGFRKRAGLPTPGKPLTGWASGLSEIVFGQIISGLARLAQHRDEPALRDKAIRLHDGWLKTVPGDGNTYAGAYGLDKYICGLVDLQLWTGHETLGHLKKIAAHTTAHLDRSRPPADAMDWDGRNPGGQNEWYTLSENLYRAYLLDGDEVFTECAELWHYPSLWDRFADGPHPTNPPVAHAYSHVNSINGAAMAYVATGDRRMLDIAVNAHDYFTTTQTYASGGYGPIEHLVTPGAGRLGEGLEHSWNHAEIGCGTWGGFKLTNHLLGITGRARFADWTERLIYNAIGAALPADKEGRAFYYADYRITGGTKAYYGNTYPCCHGTYIQDVAALHELLYYQGEDGLYVAQYLPSATEATIGGRKVTLTTVTEYPAAQKITVTVGGSPTGSFGISLRIPRWCDAPRLTVNGVRAGGSGEPATWWTVDRTWRAGDTLELTLPMRPRLEAVDPEHPRRTAVLHGPVLLAQGGLGSGRWPQFTHEGQLAERLVPGADPLTFESLDTTPQDGGQPAFKPFWAFEEGEPYRLYFDRDADFSFETPTEAGGARFVLVNADTGRMLAVAGGVQREDAPAAQTDDATRPDRLWRLVETGNARVALRSCHTGRRLAAQGSRAVLGAAHTAAEWRFQDAGDGTLYVVAHDGRSRLAAGPDGTVVLTGRRGDAARWRLTPADGAILHHRTSHRVADVAGASKEPEAVVVLWSNLHGGQQRWRFEAAGDGWSRLVNVNSRLALEAVAGDAGPRVLQRSAETSREAQHWRLVTAEGAWFTLLNRGFGKQLRVRDDATTNGAPLTMDRARPEQAGQWRLE
ncbi:beta-L-arabinofuranosidase domain-containing protein [Streptomyces sp. bgisy091]|uniref:beta-L-arabinofuranosidase domain-containing protein n=1 Tax=Streptomyces sp. bgisy091 TaxID=3413778 RepID=UPI003D743DCA